MAILGTALPLGLTLSCFLSPVACRATVTDPRSGQRRVDLLQQRLASCRDIQYPLTGASGKFSRHLASAEEALARCRESGTFVVG
jgi:hypothetical protein